MKLRWTTCNCGGMQNRVMCPPVLRREDDTIIGGVDFSGPWIGFVNHPSGSNWDCTNVDEAMRSVEARLIESGQFEIENLGITEYALTRLVRPFPGDWEGCFITDESTRERDLATYVKNWAEEYERENREHAPDLSLVEKHERSQFLDIYYLAKELKDLPDAILLSRLKPTWDVK